MIMGGMRGFRFTLARSLVRLAWVAFIVVMTSLWMTASVVDAANTPCSGRKGGIAGCLGDTFVCNDGSVSGSKKSCSAYMGGAVGLMGGEAPQMAPAVGNE